MFQSQNAPRFALWLKYLAKTFEYDYINTMFDLARRSKRQIGAAILSLVMVLFQARGVEAAELVMFERAGCPWCARWDAEVAPAYMKTEEGRAAPLRRHNLDQGQPKDIVLQSPVRYTPTFVLVDDGHEKGRITGYIDNGMFWGILKQMIAKHQTASGKDSAPQNAVSREN